MLLSVQEVADIVGIDDLEVNETYDKFLDYVEFSPDECAGVPFNTIERAYRHSGYSAVSGMVMDTADQDHWIDEGVVRFSTAADARRFVADAERVWPECAGVESRQVPEKGAELQVWVIGETEPLPDGGLQVMSRRDGTRGGIGDVCAHAMADRANIVIDVVVCGPTVTDEAVTILERIARKPPI